MSEDFPEIEDFLHKAVFSLRQQAEIVYFKCHTIFVTVGTN